MQSAFFRWWWICVFPFRQKVSCAPQPAKFPAYFYVVQFSVGNSAAASAASNPAGNSFPGLVSDSGQDDSSQDDSSQDDSGKNDSGKMTVV